MSTRITTNMVNRHVLGDLYSVTERLTRAQTKLSSNKELTRPSDDPFATSRALSLRGSMGGTQQYQRNVQDAVGWQDSAELSLARITESVQRARDLLIQGASDSVPAQARASLAKEIREIAESVKQEANAKYNGQYLFSGTAVTTSPYAPGASDAFQGNSESIGREIGPNVPPLQVNVDLAGRVLGWGRNHPVLGAAGDDLLLDNLRDIADNLEAATPAAADSLRSTDLTHLDANLDRLLDLRAQNGARSNRLELALSRLQEIEGTTLSQLSETEDADMGKTMIELNSQQAAYQAALRAGASIVQSSLMDFLR